MGFSRREYWTGLSVPSQGDLPNPGIQPRSPTCRQILFRLSHQWNSVVSDSLQPHGLYSGILLARTVEWVAIPFLQGIFPNQVSCISGRFFSIWTNQCKSLSHVQLCDPVDYTVHRILQARIRKWAAIPLSGGSSQPRDWTQVSCISGRFFTSWVTREAQEDCSGWPIPSPGDLPGPGFEPGFPALQADSLPAEPPGKPLNNAHWYRVYNWTQCQYFQNIGWVLGLHRTGWCQY